MTAEQKPLAPDQKVVFGVGQEVDGTLVITLLVPPGAAEYMAGGLTHQFDLTKVDVPVKILMAGCKDRADGIRTLEAANAAKGHATLHTPGRDFSIEPKG